MILVNNKEAGLDVVPVIPLLLFFCCGLQKYILEILVSFLYLITTRLP